MSESLHDTACTFCVANHVGTRITAYAAFTYSEASGCVRMVDD